MDGPTPRYTWRLRPSPEVDPVLVEAGRMLGMGHRLVHLLAARGHDDPAALQAWVGDPVAALHDPRQLPDAEAFVARVARATADNERVMVFGDFDADGLTGLAILTLALRRLELDVVPYVPDRTEEGHGLSRPALQRAAAEGRTLIVTADCGTSSADEIELARQHGIDVLVTDHHRPPPRLPAAAAVVNPLRADSAYPDRHLSGAGVALKCAQLLIGGGEAMKLADLAAIGTIADVAPLVGENRSIARLGLDALAGGPRPGLAALLANARIEPGRINPETLAFGLIPRLNAMGRVGDAQLAARLLLSDDPAEATDLAAQLDQANVTRRELLATALEEARTAVGEAPDGPVIVIAGPWAAGIIGLVAGRLAELHGRPAVVFSNTTDPWRGSARSPSMDIVSALASMADLFERFGGHSAAAGCHMPASNIDAFRQRMALAAGSLRPIEPTLDIDLIVEAVEVDYGLRTDLLRLEPAGPRNPLPLVGIRGLVVSRARRANGGHTQLVLRKGREVLDGICFGRDDLPDVVREGDRLDVVARLDSRTFGGYESLQLEVRDVGPAGTLDALMSARAPVEVLREAVALSA
ncbi:MAG TPA: single-stranded-DNA-specific exonuclease RecJ [Candidatus Limnocylindrales bacterium]|nr:single-stranded-DNA-specific exonuclease RecJ [Candidatus Limnocylindrales bacterium]